MSPTRGSSICCAPGADATPILSRPISVDDFDNQTGALTFLYQVKGEGTHKLAALAAGDTLTVTGPCGQRL